MSERSFLIVNAATMPRCARLEALLAAHEQPDESLQDATSEPAVKATRKLEFAEEPAELHRLSAFPRGTIFWATRAKRRADCLSSAHLRRSGTEKPGDDSILEAERMSTAMQI
jgi:hypothetical protein